MLRDLLKEGGLYTLANLLTKGVSLLLIPFYSDYFTGAEYGILALLGVSGALIAAIFSFQIYQGMGRFISDPKTSGEEKKQIASTSLFFTMSSYCIFVAVALIFQDSILNFLSEEETISPQLYYLWLGTLFLNSLFYSLGVQLKFLRKTRSFSLTSFIYAILNILLILVFALILHYRLESIFLASLLVAPPIILWQIYILREDLMWYFGKAALRRLLVFSTPLIPASLAYIALNYTDRVFIKEINQSLTAVGIYDMAFKFSAIVSLIILAFQSALAPLIYERHQDFNTKIQLGKIFKLFIAVGTLGGIFLCLFSSETLYIFTQPIYYEASTFMPLFYVSVLMTGLGMFSPGLHIMQKTKLIAITVILTSAINMILNYFLIHQLGLFGAAMATLISTIINNSTLFIISQRLYHIPVETKRFSRVLLVFVVILTGAYYLEHSNFLHYSLLLTAKILIILLFIFYLLKDKMIDFIDLKKLIQGKNEVI